MHSNLFCYEHTPPPKPVSTIHRTSLLSVILCCKCYNCVIVMAVLKFLIVNHKQSLLFLVLPLPWGSQGIKETHASTQCPCELISECCVNTAH